MVRCIARGLISAASTAAMRSVELHARSGDGNAWVYCASAACSAMTSAALRGCRMRQPWCVANTLPVYIGNKGTAQGSAAYAPLSARASASAFS